VPGNILDKIPYEQIWVIPLWQRWLAVCGAIFLFFVVYFFAYHKNASEEINKLMSDRNKLKTDHKNYVKYTKKIPQLQKEIDELNRNLQKARIQLPSAKEIPELLTLISDTGTNEGLEFLLFKPFSEEKVDFFAKVPVDMVIRGDYHNVATFFDKVKKMSRIVDISDVKIKANDRDGEISLEASCKATTYKYLEASALNTKGKKKKKKKK
tara:strand:- start:146 stop:775 length:630 start_codon:yes stop_codon:yes gene_type:complete